MRAIESLLLSLCLAVPLAAQNRVLELNGQESYVQLPGHIFDGLEEATVKAWVKWEAWDYFSQWFAFGVDDQWRAMGSNHFDATSTLQFFIYTGQEELYILPLGQWCHMAMVSGRGGMRFYLNGVLAGQNGYEGSFTARIYKSAVARTALSPLVVARGRKRRGCSVVGQRVSRAVGEALEL